MYDGVIEKPDLDDIIEHYGVKGMKWGVRRYQKYDGIRTKRSLKKVEDALTKYSNNKTNYAKTKYKYKLGKISDKSVVDKARKDMLSSKKNANKEYGNLKKAKLADEGSKLQNKGIKYSTRVKPIWKTAAKTEGALIASAVIAKSGLSTRTKLAMIAPLAGVVSASVAADVIRRNRNKKLKALYDYNNK